MTVTTATTVIELRQADARRAADYGVIFESGTVHKVTGKNVHNPSFPHRVQVWDNTRRPNLYPDRWNQYSGCPGAGRYVDPNGKGTDFELTILLAAECMVIASEGCDPGVKTYGRTLALGERIQLQFPNGVLSGEFELKTRRAHDPHLEPVV